MYEFRTLAVHRFDHQRHQRWIRQTVDGSINLRALSQCTCHFADIADTSRNRNPRVCPPKIWEGKRSPADPLNAFWIFPTFLFAGMHTIAARNIASCMHYVSCLMLHWPAGTPVRIFPARNIGFLWPPIGEKRSYRRKNALCSFSNLSLGWLAHPFCELVFLAMSCNHPRGKPPKGTLRSPTRSKPTNYPFFFLIKSRRRLDGKSHTERQKSHGGANVIRRGTRLEADIAMTLNA